MTETQILDAANAAAAALTYTIGIGTVAIALVWTAIRYRLQGARRRQARRAALRVEAERADAWARREAA